MVATLEKTETDIYIDIADLPRKTQSKNGLTQKLRDIPEQKALFIPCTEEKRANVRGNVSNYGNRLQKEMGRLYHTQFDRSRGGFWVWWEVK